MNEDGENRGQPAYPALTGKMAVKNGVHVCSRIGFPLIVK